MYPDYQKAHLLIQSLTGPCGPISVWMVLERHGIYVEPEEIIKRCMYSEDYGCYLICMAYALKSFGMSVRFHSERDLDPKPVELITYESMDVAPPCTLGSLVDESSHGASVIVSYIGLGGEGHFSPLAGVYKNRVVLAYEIGGGMLCSEFNKRWRAPEILRQAIVATPTTNCPRR